MEAIFLVIFDFFSSSCTYFAFHIFFLSLQICRFVLNFLFYSLDRRQIVKDKDRHRYIKIHKNIDNDIEKEIIYLQKCAYSADFISSVISFQFRDQFTEQTPFSKMYSFLRYAKSLLLIDLIVGFFKKQYLIDVLF